MPSARKRHGFTIFELLVILAILAMLLGFLIPAVQKVREQASRTQQANNLKQILLSVHNYAAANNAIFPPACGNAAGLKDQTISVYLLPYLEQGPLYQLIAKEGKPPLDLAIPPFQAPEDTSTMDYIRVQNFAANVRVFTDGGVNTNWDKPVVLKGSMPCTTNLNRTFLDGTSNTIAFATRYAAAKEISVGGKAGKPCGYYDLPLANDGGSFFGATPMAGNDATTSPGSGWQQMPTLDQVNCEFAIGMAHSFVKAALTVGLADGSVRTIAPAMSSKTYNIALQPNDGNPLGADW